MIRRKPTAKKGRKIGAAGDYAKFELAVIKALAKLLKKPYKKVIEAVNLDENLLNIISKSFDQKLSVKETAQKLKAELIKVAQKTPLEAFVEVLNRLPKKETTGKFSFPIKLPAAVTIGKAEQHRDYKSHNVKINVLSGMDDKLKFDEKVGLIYGQMKIVQDKIINREKLTPYEEKLFYYTAKYGFHNGSKQVVRDMKKNKF